MDQAEEVKSKADIVEVISSYVPLKKMGRNLGGLCPFHGEKTPSFMVSPERQAFKCFGCGEAGDAFTFLEKIEGWDFKEALEELAKRVGVKLISRTPSKNTQIRERLLEINTLSAKFYSHILNKHKLGEVAREYLTQRGIDAELWNKFGLGYSPDGWENSFNFLQKRGFSVSDIATSGLVVGREGKGRGGFYDRFRGRIMFPIKDNRGVVLGFSGRVITDVKEAKYINSPETPIFHKGMMLFGLDLARQAIREKNEAVLVEGEFDVISAHKAGVLNAVASKGTALTDKQVALIARLCENVALCFDTDLAGDAASRRGIELLDIAGVNVKVVKISGAKDPDELAQKDPEAFKKAIEKAQNIYDYFIESSTSRFDPKTGEGKKKIGREILPIISKISDDLMRAHFVEKLAKGLDLEVNLVSEAVKNKRSELEITPGVADKKGAKGIVALEEYFLALFLAGDRILKDIWEKLEVDDFENEEARSFWKMVRDIIIASKPKKVADLLAKIPTRYSQFVDHLYFVEISPSFSDPELWAGEIFKVAERIKRASIARALSKISLQLNEAQNKGDTKLVGVLTKQFNDLSKKLIIVES